MTTLVLELRPELGTWLCPLSIHWIASEASDNEDFFASSIGCTVSLSASPPSHPEITLGYSPSLHLRGPRLRLRDSLCSLSWKVSTFEASRSRSRERPRGGPSGERSCFLSLLRRRSLDRSRSRRRRSLSISFSSSSERSRDRRLSLPKVLRWRSRSSLRPWLRLRLRSRLRVGSRSLPFGARHIKHSVRLAKFEAPQSLQSQSPGKGPFSCTNLHWSPRAQRPNLKSLHFSLLEESRDPKAEGGGRMACITGGGGGTSTLYPSLLLNLSYCMSP